MEATTVEVFNACSQALIGLGTIALTLVIFYRSRRNEQAQFMAASLRNWIDLNNTILGSGDRELLQASNDLHGIQGTTTQEQLRIHLTYNLLNILESEFVGQRDGLLRTEYHARTAENILAVLVNRPGVMAIVESGGYHTKFVLFCRTLKKQK